MNALLLIIISYALAMFVDSLVVKSIGILASTALGPFLIMLVIISILDCNIAISESVPGLCSVS